MSLDLRTGKTIWYIEDGPPPMNMPLHENIETEVVVVGGGISGAILAHTLLNHGYHVAMVEGREISAGSSMASTAILSYETDVMLGDMIKDMGEQKAVRVFRAGNEALEDIARLVKTVDNDCGFRKRNSVYLASTKSDYKEVYKEYLTRKKHGFDLEFLAAPDIADLFSFNAPAALLTPGMAEIDPVKFTRALIGASEKQGMKVYSQTRIKNYHFNRHSKMVSLTTNVGYCIKAHHVVFASGYETQEMLKQKTVKLNSSYAIASEPIDNFDGWYQRSTIWESARPYIYLRTSADNRIIAGGEDEPFENEEIRDGLIEKKTEKLVKKVKEKFPHIPFRLAAAWAGTFAESDDGLPYIGACNKYPGAWFALGYGGNGITFSAMAARIIPDLIAGKKNTDADIFSFKRKPLPFWKKLFA